jgi:putative transcriptional regulator
MKIGNKLETLRTNCGFQREDVATTLGVAQSTLSHWERDKREPSFEMLDKLAELYNTTVSEIFVKDYSEQTESIIIKESTNVDLLASTIINMGKNNDLNENDGFSKASESAKQILLGLLDLHIKKLLKSNKDTCS